MIVFKLLRSEWNTGVSAGAASWWMIKNNVNTEYIYQYQLEEFQQLLMDEVGQPLEWN